MWGLLAELNGVASGKAGVKERPRPCAAKKGAQLIISIRLDAAEHTHAQAYSDREQDEKTGYVPRDKLLH